MAGRKHKSNALDPLLAGFAAGASAFIIYAMPDWRFEQAVSLSGLAAILPAAQPPLGGTARFAAMALAAIGSFLLVWYVLRALGKPAPKRRRPAPISSSPVEIPVELPKLRRADAHPDAPARRPILAGLDLGPRFDDVDVDAQPEREPEPVEESNAAAPEEQEERAEEPEVLEVHDKEPIPEPAEASGESDKAVPAEVVVAAVAPAAVEAEPTLPSLPEGEPSLSDLMQRFESGLRRREAPRWGGSANNPADPVDARLRGAIAELQRMAKRGG